MERDTHKNKGKCILEPKWHKTQDAPTTKPPTNQTVGFNVSLKTSVVVSSLTPSQQYFAMHVHVGIGSLMICKTQYFAMRVHLAASQRREALIICKTLTLGCNTSACVSLAALWSMECLITARRAGTLGCSTLPREPQKHHGG